MVTAAGALAAADVRLDDISLRQPTLDEVFLTLTGSVPEAEQAEEERILEEVSS